MLCFRALFTAIVENLAWMSRLRRIYHVSLTFSRKNYWVAVEFSVLTCLICLSFKRIEHYEFRFIVRLLEI